MNKLPYWASACVLSLFLYTERTAAAASHDVIPLAWIDGTGGECARELTEHDTAIILPSCPGPVAKLVSEVAANFLTRDNRIPTPRVDYPWPAFVRSALGQSPQGAISIDRGEIDGKELDPTTAKRDRTSPRLTISADVDAVATIRSLNWEKFRALQEDFAHWLAYQNRPKYLYDRFKRPIEGFRGFEETLQSFWRKTLTTARFDGYFDAKKAEYFGGLLRREANAAPGKSAGLNLGAVPLRPGVRLAIHWGGTAVYAYLGDNVTRQTSAGTSYVDITGSANSVTFSPLSPFVLTSSLATRTIQALPQGAATTIPRVLPFGDKNTIVDMVVPAYNEFDLHNADAFAPLTDSPPSSDAIPAHRTARELVLLVPANYTKSDVGDHPTFAAHDASSIDRFGGAETVEDSLYRRFAIWAEDRPFSEASLKSKDFTLSTKQARRSLVFGNQTWIDVEVPVSVNGQNHWVGLKTRMGEFFARHTPWLLMSASDRVQQQPLFRFVRTGLAGQTQANPTFEFRFWVPPGENMAAVELLPRDSILFHP